MIDSHLPQALQQIKKLVLNQEFKEALDKVAIVEIHYPNNADLLYAKAYCTFRLGDFQEAKAHANTLVLLHEDPRGRQLIEAMPQGKLPGVARKFIPKRLLLSTPLFVVYILITLIGTVALGWRFVNSRDPVRPKPVVSDPRQKLLKESNVDLGNGVTLELVWIPAGSFNRADEKTGSQYEVTLSEGFWMGKYEVTQEQWSALLGRRIGQFDGPDNPVENVLHFMVDDFLKALNEKTGGGKFRLPTEAEWEYACRAGSKTKYYFGDDGNQLGDYAWYSDNAGASTHAVGQKKPNAWGLFDMYGNVEEICQDYYAVDYYIESPTMDPPGPKGVPGDERVARGGSYIGQYCGSGIRGHFNPSDEFDAKASFRGFRLVRDDAQK